VPDRRDGERDHPGPATPQVAGRKVRAVLELGDDGLDACSRGGAHPTASVDDVRHGLDRDAGTLGDIAQAGGHGRPPAGGRPRAEKAREGGSTWDHDIPEGARAAGVEPVDYGCSTPAA